MKDEIKVFAPATVSNVGCGFDIMGFAINKLGDEVKIKLTSRPEIVIKSIKGDGNRLPLDPRKNTVSIAVSAMRKHLKQKDGIEINLYKKMPLGSGLGSSAASAVAGVFALNALLDNPLSNEDLLAFALEGEKITSGGIPHADNVAPCLYGGFVIVRSCNPLDVIKIPTPKKLYTTIIYPHVEVITADARRMLKKHIPLKKAVVQWGNVAGLVAGLMSENYNLIARSLHDEIIEPVRAKLIPGFHKMKETALNSGALGCSISGSGPSIFALSISKEIAEKVARSMKKVLGGMNVECSVYVSKINSRGPRIILR